LTRWRVEHVSGTVARLHERSQSLLSGVAGTGPVALVLHPVDQALVLGSAQADVVVDRRACAAAGIDVVRRRSGGGAVLVQPGKLVWVDLFVPAGDPLWQPDVGRSAWWLGEAWVSALAAQGLAGAGVWKGAMLRRPWSAQVCFAGLAAGEVTLAGGAKVVGISQRRARYGALFQSACLSSWEPGLLLGLLALSSAARAAAAEALAEVAAGVGASAGDALGPFLSALP